jgi:seryl-tRNA synthetase
MAPLNQEESRLKDERAQIVKDQERIRANIESLKSGASQRELAERFVTKLNEQEDRLEAIAREQERVTREKKELQAEVNRKLQELTFTKDLGTPSTEMGRGPR